MQRIPFFDFFFDFSFCVGSLFYFSWKFSCDFEKYEENLEISVVFHEIFEKE